MCEIEPIHGEGHGASKRHIHCVGISPGVEFSEGQNIVVGLRPQDVFLEEGSNDIPDDWKFEAEIIVTEPLGSETYMHLDVGGLKITGKCEGRRAVHPNEKIKLTFNLNHLHIFDAASTQSIY